MLDLHVSTKLKLRFDEALVKIQTGLEPCDCTISCIVEGVSFPVRIEEVKGSDKVEVFTQAFILEFDCDSLASEEDGMTRLYSVEAMLEGWSEKEKVDGVLVNGGVERTLRSNGHRGGTSSSGNVTVAAEGIINDLEKHADVPNVEEKSNAACEVLLGLGPEGGRVVGLGPDKEVELGLADQGSSKLCGIAGPLGIDQVYGSASGPGTEFSMVLEVEAQDVSHGPAGGVAEGFVLSGILRTGEPTSRDYCHNNLSPGEMKAMGVSDNHTFWGDFVKDLVSSWDLKLLGKKKKGRRKGTHRRIKNGK